MSVDVIEGVQEDLWILQDLAPPCEGPCDDEAVTWWMKVRTHECSPETVQTVPLCRACKDTAISPNTGVNCVNGHRIRLVDYIIDLGPL